VTLWLVVFAMKFFFDYHLVLKTAVSLTVPLQRNKALLAAVSNLLEGSDPTSSSSSTESSTSTSMNFNSTLSLDEQEDNAFNYGRHNDQESTSSMLNNVNMHLLAPVWLIAAGFFVISTHVWFNLTASIVSSFTGISRGVGSRQNPQVNFIKYTHM
jgi:hypothetical protein